ncbi:MAG: hypothetical protein ACRC9T_06160 [Vibrionaceae bacterium]
MKIDSILLYKQNVPSDFLASTESTLFYKLVLTVYKIALSLALIVLTLFAFYMVNFAVKQSSTTQLAPPSHVCMPSNATQKETDKCLSELAKNVQRPVPPKTISLSSLSQFINDQMRYFLAQSMRALDTAAFDLQKSFAMLSPASRKSQPASEDPTTQSNPKPIFSWYNELSNLLLPSKLVEKSTVTAVGNTMLHPEIKIDPSSLAESLREKKQSTTLRKGNAGKPAALGSSDKEQPAIPEQTISVAIGYVMQEPTASPLHPASLNNEQPQQNILQSDPIKNEALLEQNNGQIMLDQARIFGETTHLSMQQAIQQADIKKNAKLILPYSATLGEHHRLQFDEKFKDFFN